MSHATDVKMVFGENIGVSTQLPADVPAHFAARIFFDMAASTWKKYAEKTYGADGAGDWESVLWAEFVRHGHLEAAMEAAGKMPTS